MYLRRIFVTAALVLGLRVTAQTDNGPAGIPVRIWATAQGGDNIQMDGYSYWVTTTYAGSSNYYGKIVVPGATYYEYAYPVYSSLAANLELHGTFMPSLPTDPNPTDGNAANGTSTSDAYAQLTANLGIVRMMPGGTYTVYCSQDNIQSGVLNVQPPPGYRVILEGVPRNSCSLSGAMMVRVVPLSDGIPGTAGFASPIAALKIDWKLSLGSLLNGDSAGYLELVDAGTATSWSPLYTPAALSYEAASSEVYVYRVGNTVRQIIANQIAADIVTLNSTSYEIRCYNPRQIQSTVPCTFSGLPYVVYRIERGTPDAAYASDPTAVVLKLTKETRTITDLNATNVPIARREIMTLQRTGNWPAFRWARTEWTVEGQPALEQTVVQSSGPSSARSEAVTVAVPNGATAVSLGRVYDAANPFGELLKTETVGTGTGLTTTFQFNTDVNQPGSFGYLKSVALPGGRWESYDYYDASILNGYAGGRIKYRYRPFGSAPSTAAGASIGAGEVTYYEYGPDPFGFMTRPTLVDTFVNGTKTNHTTVTYSIVRTNGNSYSVVQQTETTNTGASTSLQTIKKYYGEDASSALIRGKPVSVENPDGTKQVFTYETGSWNGTAFTPISSAGLASRVTAISGSRGYGTLNQDGKYFQDSTGYEAVYVFDGKSTKSVTIRDERALVVRSESYVWSGGAWQLLSYVNYAYNHAGLLVSQTSSNGTTSTATYEGLLKTNDTDAGGVTTTYTYDALDRVQVVTKQGVGPIGTVATHYRYDAMSNVLEERVGWGQAEQLVTIASYDDAGRMIASASPGLGTVTQAYDAANRTHTTQQPDGGTVVETAGLDGRPSSKTGTATVAQYFTYGVDIATGQRWTRVNSGKATSPRWAQTYTDWAGRTVASIKPAPGSTPTAFDGNFASSSIFLQQSVYDDVAGHASTGHLVTSTETGKAPTRFVYDWLGRVTRSGLDVDSNGALDLVSNDRVTEQDQYFELYNGDWWSHEESRAYTQATSGTPVVTSIKRQRVTGFGSGKIDEVQLTDVNQNVTTQTTTLNRATATASVTKTTTGIAQPEVETQIAGFAVSSRSTAGLVTQFGYDSLRRKTTVTDSRGNTTTTAYLNGSALVQTVTDATNTVVATNAYDAMGRVISATDAAGHHVYSAYSRRGEAVRQWGDGTSAVEYAFDTYGERIALRTFRNPSQDFTTSTWPLTDGELDSLNPDPSGWTNGDKTTWTFDAATGVLSAKTDALGRTVNYGYNVRGQLATRTWARNVVTTYGYDSATAEQRDITYSDGTPALHYVYNRLGQSTEIDDVTGAHVFTYTTGGQVMTEQLSAGFFASRLLTAKLAQTQGAMLNRVVGYTLAVGGTTEQNLTYDFDPASGRLGDIATQTTVASASHTFNYGYLPSANLIATLSIDSGHPFSVTRTFEAQRDVLTSIDSKWSAASRTRYDYTTNTLGQRVSKKQSGDVFADYGDATYTTFGYDAKGEVTSASEYLGSTADSTKKLPDRQHEYAYDNIGNRQWSNQTGNSGLRDNYTSNALNQYITRENNTAAVSGTTDVNARVNVGGRTNAASRQGAFWSDDFTVANVSGPWYGAFTIYSGKSGAGPSGSDLVRTEVRLAQLAAQLQSFAYDADGNLTSDGVWDYTWDAENRLTAMQTTTVAAIAGYPNQRLEFKYDYLGRRAEKLVRGGWNGSTFTTVISQRRFIYDGWNLIAEYAVSGSSSLVLGRTFTWGFDIARTFTDAGGVGALLEIADIGSKKTYLPTYDGNGNIMAVLNADTGSIAAAYEYNPYGEALRSDVNDPAMANQPFRFSTKYTDTETGLLYYGRRYYDPRNGRFLGRDSIEEKGGLHLYAFCLNNPINAWDVLGNGIGDAIMSLVNSVVSGIGGLIDDFTNALLGNSSDDGGGGGSTRGQPSVYSNRGQSSFTTSAPNAAGQNASNPFSLLNSVSNVPVKVGNGLWLGSGATSGFGIPYPVANGISDGLTIAGQLMNPLNPLSWKALGSAMATIGDLAFFNDPQPQTRAAVFGLANVITNGSTYERITLVTSTVAGVAPSFLGFVPAPTTPLSIGELLAGFPSDTKIHLTPFPTSDFQNGVLPGTYWAQLGDVAHLSTQQYRVGVVGPAAPGYGPSATLLVVVSGEAPSFQSSTPSAFGYPEFVNTKIVMPSTFINVPPGPPVPYPPIDVPPHD